MAASANRHGPVLRRRRAAVLTAAALILAALAGPARATAGPGTPAPHPASAPGSVFPADAPAPAPPPSLPPNLNSSGPAQVQALEQKYETDAANDEQKADQLAGEKTTLEQRAGDIQNRESTLATQAANLENQAKALTSQAETLDGEIEAHNAEPHTFQLPDQEAAYEAYNEEKASLDAQQAKLQSQLNALKAQSDKLQSDQAAAQADQTRLEADVQRHNDAVAALESDVENLANERQQILSQIADLLQNAAAGQQDGEPDAPATEGADESAPPAAAAPPPQAQALPSGGGDESAPAESTYTPVGDGTAEAPPTGPASGPARAAAAPAPTQTPVAVTLAPSTVKGLPAGEAENLQPSQTFDGLIPEPNGDYAAEELQPPAGESVPPAQKAFSDVINKGGKATTSIGGRPATVDRVVPVRAAPAADAGGDTPRPEPAAPKPKKAPKWLPTQSLLSTPTTPAVSLDGLRSLLARRGLGDLADQYDFEFAPVMIDGEGNPLLGSAPKDLFGNPQRGATGKPVFRFTNLGLQNPDQAIRAFTQDLVDTDLSQIGTATFGSYQYLTGKLLQRPAFRYQRFVTGQEREEVWKLNGREIHVDGGPGANNAILEAKWTGGDKQWASSPYNPANGLFDETKTVDQAAMLLALNRSLAGPGVHYLVSNQEGAAFFTALFREWFPEQMASGELTVEYKSGAGM